MSAVPPDHAVPLLRDKVVVVSGVGPGLGVKAAKAVAAAGARVVCVARTAAFLDRVTDEIRAADSEASAVAADIAVLEDCARVADVVRHMYGRLDGLINSAYTAGVIAPFSDGDLTNWRAVMDVNFFGTLQLTHALLPLLTVARGSVVNVNTTSAIRPMKGQGAYGASKAALEFATRLLAVETGGSGVRFNTVYCGPMIGPSLDAAMDAWAERRGVPRAEIEGLVAGNFATGHIPADDDAAQVLVAMLSDQCRLLTGTAIQATGGAWVEQHI